MENFHTPDFIGNNDILPQQWTATVNDNNVDVDERDAEFLDDLRAVSGIGKKRRKVKKN